MTPGDLFECRDVTVSPPHINRENPAGPGRNQTFYFSMIDSVTLRIDIAEDGRDPEPLQCVRGGDESERRQDNFAFETECTNHDFERSGRITRRNAVLHPGQFSDVLFKPDHVWTIVRKPSSIENVVNSIRKLLPVADVRTANVQWLLKRRTTAKKSEVVNRFLCRANPDASSS